MRRRASARGGATSKARGNNSRTNQRVAFSFAHLGHSEPTVASMDGDSESGVLIDAARCIHWSPVFLCLLSQRLTVLRAQVARDKPSAPTCRLGTRL